MKESAEFREGSDSLRGKKSVCSSRKLENSEVTGKVHSKKTPYPESSVQSSPSKLQEKTSDKKPKVAGPEVKTRKQRKPDEKENLGHGGCREFFKDQPLGYGGHRKSHNHNITCDRGVRSSSLGYDTFPRTYHSDARTSKLAHKRPVFTLGIRKLSDGLEEILHYGHPLGSCEECRSIVVRRKEGGDMYVEESRGKLCNIM